MTDILIYDNQHYPPVADKIRECLSGNSLDAFCFSHDLLEKLPEAELVWLYLSDEQLKHILILLAGSSYQIAILPHPQATRAAKGLNLHDALDSAIKHYLTVQAEPVDLLLCNGSPVLQSVVVGDMFGFFPGAEVHGLAEKWAKLTSYWRGLSQIVPKKITLQSRNSEPWSTAAVGVTVVEHGRNSTIGRWLLPNSHINDGMFHALILAPRSVAELLKVMLVSLFFRSQGTVPRSVGIIKTSELNISSEQGLHFFHDGIALCAKELVFRNYVRALQVRPSGKLLIEQMPTAERETRKLHNLPVGEGVAELCSKPLRWIAHAAQDDFRELYQTLREQACLSSVFLTLMTLSTLLAAVGLFANSAPVIIGAMILAPLMGPIVSLAMALARQDEQLLSSSVRTLLAGLGLALLFAMASTLVLPLHQVTDEISARVSPNLLDLAVAVISGIAGAYAHARASVAKSLAGVSIAVALVPPLAVTGIGLGWRQPELIGGAFLLFITNLAGIVLAAAVTFLALGFAPFKRARKGLLLSALAVLLVSVPLALSFRSITNHHEIIDTVKALTIDSGQIRAVQVRGGSPLTLELEVVASTPLERSNMGRIKEQIEKKLAQPVILEISVSIRME